MKPLLSATGDQLIALLPDDPESILAKLKKNRGAPSEDPAADADPDSKPAAPAPKAAPATGKRTEATPSAPPTNERSRLNSLVDNTTPAIRR